MKREIICFITISLCSFNNVSAQSDPMRVVVIEDNSQKSEKALKAQDRAMAGMTAGHIWLQEEIEATTNLQREFNEYLDNFHDVLTVAAEIYGITYEVKQAAKTVQELEDILEDNPSNALAVAFSTRRNVIYRNIVKNCTDLVMDIQTLFSNYAKMSEKQRLQIVNAIRPRIRKMNKQLRTLAIMLQYTSFMDVWYEIEDRANNYVTHTEKAEIARRCIRDWRYNLRERINH